MKTLFKSIIMLVVIGSFASCSNMNKKMEDKLKDLTKKAEHLDSLVNKEVNKVMALDSLIKIEGSKILGVDSLIKKSLKLDSIADKKINDLKKVIN